MKTETYFRDSKMPMPSGEKSGFAKRLEELRKESGLTKDALSKKLNLAKSTYGTYENDKYLPDPKTIRDIAEFYHTTTDYLLGLTDERYIADRKKERKVRRNTSYVTVKESLLYDSVREYEKREREIDKRRMAVEDFFDQKCSRIRGIILYEPEAKMILEDLVTDKDFTDFLNIAYLYTTYSAKIKKEEVRRLKRENLYEKIFMFDLSDGLMGKVNRVDSGLTIQEVYYGLMHKSLDKMIGNFIGKNHYIQELMRVIEEERARLG